MQRTPLSGGPLIRGTASRPAVLATFPWISLRHRDVHGNKLWSHALARVGQTGTSQSHALEHVLEQLRKAQGIGRLAPNVEAVVAGRGKHLGIAVSWNLRWNASGCFSEEIRGPQLTFKWGYDGRKDSGCWEVDSSGLVRIMECDDHEAVLMTTYIRTGCWLQPHLQDRFDMELLPTPVMSSSAAGGSHTISSSSSSVSNKGRGTGGSGSSSSSSSSSGASAEDSLGVGSYGPESTAAAVNMAETSGSSSSTTTRTSADTASATASAAAAATATAMDTPTKASATVRHPPRRKAALVTHGSTRGHVSQSSDDILAIGLRLKSRKLRVRVLVRRRDWRLLGFDHRMCADVETWELGEWKEWAEGVQYPSSALHKASNGGQHAYLTSIGAAEQVALLPSLPSDVLLPSPAAAAAAATAARIASSTTSYRSSLEFHESVSLALSDTPASRPSDSSTAAAVAVPLPLPTSLLPPPTDFGLPLLPPIPGDTSYSLQGGSREAVPLWKAASGHYLVRPSINGQPGGGYFVLDTGASGFVVTPQAAARLGGQSFGETHAASISGKVAARFVRLNTWSLGGLCIKQPVLMVMALDGLVRGAPGEVVGIVGHDLFRRAVVEVPQVLGAAAGRASVTAAGVYGSGSESAPDTGSGSDGTRAFGEAVAASALGREEVGTPTESALYTATGDGDGPPFGPPPPPPRSTPVFDDGDASVTGAVNSRVAVAAAGGREAGGHACAAAAVGQPLSIAAAAVPSPSAVLTPAQPPPQQFSSASSSSLSAPRDAHGALAGSCSSSSRLGNSSSVGGTADASRRESERSSSSTEADTSSRCNINSSSRSVSGSGSVTRASAGRSATARAVRRAARSVPYSLHDIVLHHPLEYSNESDHSWVWEPLVMIANLPHVHLRFADPTGGPAHSALLMVDSGACGADLMLHARAQKELGLAAASGAGQGATAAAGGGGESRLQGHYLRGVGQDPKDFVQLQVLDLPWLEMAGVRFEQVRCMCAAVGGLDISIYSHGILCGDLLARLEWAIDYTHKRIGFRRGAFAPAPQ